MGHPLSIVRLPLQSSLIVVCLLHAAGFCAAQGVTLHEKEGAIEVRHHGELFTRYVYNDTPKPILYPVLGPGGVPMTRDFPMRRDSPGEARDHVHHRSLWFAHGDVNGVDFWLEGPGKGTIRHERFDPLVGTTDAAPGAATLTAHSAWVGPDERVVCRETRWMTFRAEPSKRRIDLRIMLSAGDEPLVFGDTKEGTMALRVRPELRLTPDRERGGLPKVFGNAVNSEGLTGGGVWGQPARWVDYYAEIEGRPVGVAVFDHPSNLRHPTRWHAREYGLFAANPFGLHDFAGRPEGEGRHEVPARGSITFRYRYVFHEGDPKAAGIESDYSDWAAN